MTQAQRSRLGTGRLIALGSALIALGAIGWAVLHQRPAATLAAPGSAGMSVPSAGIDSLEAAVEAKPQDPSAWQALGGARFDAGQYAGAVDAYARLTALKPQDAQGWSALGEARVMASERDPMPADALAAFQKAATLDAANPRARYFLAVKKDLDGDHQGAISDWLALLKDTPPGAPWLADLTRTIEQVGKINRIPVTARIAANAPKAAVATAGIPGPDKQALAQATSIPPSQQRSMADQMVASLDAKLKANPDNVDGWIMLIRSRMVLNQPDKAAQALRDAIASNPTRAEMLRQQAAILGVE